MKFCLLHITPVLLFIFVTSDGRRNKSNQCTVGRKIRRQGECPEIYWDEGRPQTSTFKFLESIATNSKSITEVNRDSLDQENYYYASRERKTWTKAEQECKSMYGGESGLVSIETVKENDRLNYLLEVNGLGKGIFWIGGKYYPEQKHYRWSTSQVIIPTKETEWRYNPWKYGYPTSNPKRDTRVILTHINRDKSEWLTTWSATRSEYICERPFNTTEVIPCYTDLDLDILIDSSGSIGAANFQMSLAFIAKLTSAFTIYARGRIGLLLFSSVAKRELHIDSGLKTKAIQDEVMKLKWLAGGTLTHLALRLSSEELLAKRRKQEIPLKMLVVTDGLSNLPALTLAEAKRVKSKGITTYVVGITDNVNDAELQAIAGDDKSRVFKTSEFNKLFELITSTSKKICID